MIWYDIVKIEKKLVDGELSEKEGFYYLFALLVLSAIGRYTSSNNYENKWFMLIEAIVLIFLISIRLWTTFKINENGDGKDYLKRYVSLALVVKIRLYMYSIVIGIPIIIILSIFFFNTAMYEPIMDIMTFSMPIVLSIIYYFMLINSFRRVNSKS